MDPTNDDRLVEVQAALTRHDWETAYDLATGLIGEDSDPAASEIERADRLSALAEAAWWAGHVEAGIEARQEAYALYDAAGANRPAGWSATRLYFDHEVLGTKAIASGWLRRARRALDDERSSPEYGWLLVCEAELAHAERELDGAYRLADEARELGRRLRNADVEALGLQAGGQLLIDQGRPAEGLAHLDEAMLFILEGRLGPLATGWVHCSMINGCHRVGDVRRMAEWIGTGESWAEGHPSTMWPGTCRLHRADVLAWRGEWDEAEQVARQASEELAAISPAFSAAALVEVAEIRRRLGDLDGAEAAFAQAEQLSARPAGGLALLRLAQGRGEAAQSIITAALEETRDDALTRGWLLPAAVQICVALGDLDAARRHAEELAQTANTYESPVLLASSMTSVGRVQLAAGDEEASASLRAAVRLWQELAVPYEVATARLLLAQARRSAGDENGATEAIAAAEATFARLGATVDLRAARAMTGAGDLPGGLSDREAEVLRLVAAGEQNKTIAVTLCISQKTVSRHLSNIFTKIGVRSRAAATAWAFEHGLITR